METLCFSERIGDTIHDLSKSLADTYLEMPRRTPPRPTRPTSAGTSGCIADLQPPRSLGSSPGRVADLSSIHKVYDGLYYNYLE